MSPFRTAFYIIYSAISFNYLYLFFGEKKNENTGDLVLPIGTINTSFLTFPQDHVKVRKYLEAA
jgi:hypothetical protein